MTTRTTVYGVIFAGLIAWAFSSAALATEQDEMMEEDSPISSTDQSGMPEKDTAGHEKMQGQGGMKQGSSMDKSKTQKMEDDAPISSTDQSGMEKKDSANTQQN